MEKTGITITKRKDGRYVGKFITDYDISGKAHYQYVYGMTYDEAESKVLIGREIASRYLSGRYITVVKVSISRNRLFLYYRTTARQYCAPSALIM